jgi:hypothetical protein
MNKVVTFLFSIIFVIGIQQAFAAPEIDDEVIVAFDSDVKVIPDWVKTTMGYYLSDQISERESFRKGSLRGATNERSNQ